MPSHINQEIAAGFLDEVQAQISAIRHGVAMLKNNPSGFAAFEEVHSLLVSIRTSALVAGLTTLSHIANYQAVALEEIASGLLEWTSQTTKAFDTAIEQMEACSSAASLGPVDDRAILKKVAAVFRRLRNLPEEELDEEIDALESQDVAERLLPSLPTDQGWGFDSLPEDLIDTFRHEAGEHLAAIGGWLKNERPVLADIRRSVHTLKGAAGSVGLRQLSALADRMEHLLEQNNDEYPGELFAATLNALSELSSGKEFSSDLQTRVELLHSHYEDLAGSFTAATEGWNEDSLSPDLAGIFHEEAAELLLSVPNPKGYVLIVDSLHSTPSRHEKPDDMPRTQVKTRINAFRALRKRGVIVFFTAEASRGFYAQRDPAVRTSSMGAGAEARDIEYGSDVQLVLTRDAITGIVKDQTLYVQAAAGVVADSVPELEWKETEAKARALIRAAELVEEGF